MTLISMKGECQPKRQIRPHHWLQCNRWMWVCTNLLDVEISHLVRLHVLDAELVRLVPHGSLGMVGQSSKDELLKTIHIIPLHAQICWMVCMDCDLQDRTIPWWTCWWPRVGHERECSTSAQWDTGAPIEWCDSVEQSLTYDRLIHVLTIWS